MNDADPSSRLPWWGCVPIALALLVAISQVYLAHTAQLTPAKGGGFGLFSTVDKLNNRVMRAYLITEDQGEIPFAIPRYVPESQELRKPIYRAMSLPTDAHLRVVVDDLLAKDYDAAVRGVRVEVWKMSFDADAWTMTRVKIAEMSGERGGR